MTETPGPDGLGLGFEIPERERTALVDKLLRVIAKLREELRCVRAELDRVKGVPPQPERKPSMLGSTQPPGKAKAAKPAGKRPGSAKRHKTRALRIDERIVLTPLNLPPQARRTGHRDYVVQDLIFQKPQHLLATRGL